MIKYALLSFQFLGLFVLGLFTENVVMIDNQTPTMLAPGEKKEVTITIDKSEIQGFAKLEVFLPGGLIATAGNTGGASFTFHEQKARFVWMNMPTERSFKVTYYIECVGTEAKNADIKGAFSYIEKNKRVDFIIPVRTIAVQSENVTAQSQAPTEAPVEKTDAPVPPADAPAGGATAVTAAPAEMTCTRTITALSATEFQIDIRVSGNTIEGFAKIMESVPANCKTEKIQDAGSVVTQEKNSIKFVWFEIPKSPIVDISYKISCLTPPASPLAVTGKLSYVQNSTPKELTISTGSESTQQLAQNTPKDEPKNSGNTSVANPEKTVPAQDVAQNNPTHAEPKKQSPPVKKEHEKAVANVPAPETVISYKVQILAAHRVVNKTYFQQKHGFSDAFNIENHEGWMKYTTGRYNEYRQARDAREQITLDHNSLPGPFVTAYNDGQRITVQEALLISKQQWFK
ncbi:MAG: hypothetical protein ACK5XQ_02325 [Flavobacteriales bacterium]